ncbi:hypothetical protein OB955_01490 [Halobacteria archaeon AArc-m2/3/4]|uniref:Uncharacterized protein n=1 Tax=Natronoglomus mannanivorans TaxID=2979990 RepID=A0AAP3E0K7_9EURY|nr:hypothetical protein [Halobacteria archaeon AArc-xg1-1]MCU4971413.1 hypothetical protein [Halobacteria archaeon AArc-m2/3/4]
MRYPHGRCESCGERLYEHTDGVIQCLNCEEFDPDDERARDEDEDGDGGRAVPVAM